MSYIISTIFIYFTTQLTVCFINPYCSFLSLNHGDTKRNIKTLNHAYVIHSSLKFAIYGVGRHCDKQTSQLPEIV